MSAKRDTGLRREREQASKEHRGSTAAATRQRAAREHQGRHHWHVRRRSTVIVCQACGDHIPRSLRPSHCPGCGAGKA